jgi:hypothetical protein
MSFALIFLIPWYACLTYHRFRRAGYQAIDRICDYYISLRDKPVSSQVEPGYLRKALPGIYLPFWLVLSV